jgi:2-isopropylmalate synthase
MKVEIYDTTLRDGAQAEGISFSVADKVKIAHRLDEFGVAYIEGGWPGSNPKTKSSLRWPKSKSGRTRSFAPFR